MRKRVILTLMLAVALVVTTGCSLIIKDEEVDRQTTIIDVAGKTITKGEVNEQVEAMLDYQEYMYYLYGMSFDRTSASNISDARDSVIEGLVQEAVLDQKTAEMGLDELTDDELAEVRESAETTWQGYKDSVQSAYFSDSELTDEALDEAVEAKLAELGYPSKEDLEETERVSKAREKLRAEVIKDVTVSEDEVSAEYENRKGEAMTTYGNTPSSFGTDVTNGSTIYYVPAGYRYVKNILIKISDENSTLISDLQSQITSKETELSNAETSLAELGEDADDEETEQSRSELTATQEQLTADLADLNGQLDAAKEAAYAAIQPKADEVLAKLAEGEDFDALMEEYGEDTGMQVSPAKENGYPVCAESTNWVTEFRDAAMALENIGDVSEAVRTSYGLHIIQYVSDAEEGAVPYEDVKDTIESDLLTNKQNETYDAAVDQWVTDANAKIYKDRLD